MAPLTPTQEQPATPASASELWTSALSRLRGRTSATNFETYLRSTEGVFYDAEASVLHVAASNPFHVPWLERNFGSAVHRAVAEVVGAPVRVEMIARPDQGRTAARRRTVSGAPRPMDVLLTPAPVPATNGRNGHNNGQNGHSRPPARDARLGSPLNPRYTFDSFVVGQSNQLAHAASLAVVDEPGRAYNPLFLYGGVGLGKTHLLHAMGHAVASRGLTVVYVSSETFTNELIESIRQRRTDEFRAKYRRADVLLIDDVQFIAGKERTEEEFFHTFNAIHEAGGQVALTSDRPPRGMTVLEDRLRSRFEWGLIADLQLPDYETRVAILRTKLGGVPDAMVPREVVEFMAQRVQSNIRELEGSLNRLLAYARHLRQPITVELAGLALRDLMTPGATSAVASPAAIVQAVCRFFGVSAEELGGKVRRKEIVVPRQLAMYLLREDARLSTPDIGRLLNRDHTTILHGANLVADDIARNGASRTSVRGVREILHAST